MQVIRLTRLASLTTGNDYASAQRARALPDTITHNAWPPIGRFARMEPDENVQPDERPTSAPENLSVSLCAFDSEQHAREFGNLIVCYARELSRYIDLSGLDGITVAHDYSQALAELDRGYATSHRLTPSEEFVTGIAMTPSVLRDGQLKSHIVLDAGFALALENPEGEHFPVAFHTLAHECAHVEITQRFENAFPGVLLRKRRDTIHDNMRWQVIGASWDEYAATYISAPFGHDPTAWYEECFLTFLKETRPKANGLIKAYRLHGDHSRIMGEVYGAYGELLKSAAYVLGNMAGRKLSLDALPATQAALNGHWFAGYFNRLDEVCKRIFDGYGKWTETAPFEALGDLADDLVAEGGLRISVGEGGRVRIDVPFTAETMP
jgi:hypothetical protein